MAAPEESSQLPLSITVSPWSGFLYKVKKNIREFKYSAVVLVFTHLLFWVNAGIVAIMGWLLLNNKSLLEKGIGIVFVPGKESIIPSFAEFAVQNLSMFPYIWYLMIGLFILSVVVSVLIYSFGRYGITTFVMLLTTILLTMLAKVLVTPILLLGGL